MRPEIGEIIDGQAVDRFVRSVSLQELGRQTRAYVNANARRESWANAARLSSYKFTAAARLLSQLYELRSSM